MHDGPIGVMDSGVGGLSVWRELVREMPQEDTIYFADQAHLPYGSRQRDEIRGFCTTITEYLIGRHCKAVVVACNTASAAALKQLRETFPDLPTIGMEPAVKPAAAITKTGVVGILATPATFQGALFKATAGRHADGVQLINQVCDGLAEQIESGDLTGPGIQALLKRYLEPMLTAGADTVVLGCTHYPFAADMVRRIAGPDITVIDPAPAVARYVQRVLSEKHLRAQRERPANHRFVTTADGQRFSQIAKQLLEIDTVTELVSWINDERLSPRDEAA
ncbi:MAG: glutamate racemase [Proteobacteria bacterium]|nr:glutamate racemase [Pseudomonadota bacterium]